MTQPESLKLIFCVEQWELNGSKNNFTAKVTLHYSKRSLFWSLIIFGYLSFTTVRGQKIRFNNCECIKFLNNANIHALHILGKRIFICNKFFFPLLFSVYSFCNAIFFYSSNVIKPPHTKLHYLRSSAFNREPFLPLYGALFVKILYLTDLAQKLLRLRIFSYLCTHLAIPAQR